MNKPARIIDGKSYIWVAEYRSPEATERHAHRLRMRGQYVRIIRDKQKDSRNIYARPGRPWMKPRP
jgi:hypothetical protein